MPKKPERKIAVATENNQPQPDQSFSSGPKIDDHASASAPLLPGNELPDIAKAAGKPSPPSLPKEKEPFAEKEEADPIKDEIGLEDKSTGNLVDEIIEEESDRLLAIDDAKAELSKGGLAFKKKSLPSKVKAALSAFWNNKLARNLTFGGIVLLLGITFVVPSSRYFTLNLVGVRASTSMKIVDGKTNQPLKNVEVTVSGVVAKSDKDGQVELKQIKLGRQALVAKKPAFADLNQKMTFGWGSNPIGEISLTAVGSRYTFVVEDFLSAKPLDAEAISGEYSARADKKGEIVLAVNDENQDFIEIDIVADNYRTETKKLAIGTKEIQKLKLVPSKKHAFVSKRSGKYDLFKIDADGQNEELVLKATGKESEDKTVVLTHKSKNIAAFVTTRGEKYNADGFALSSLLVIDLDTNQAVKAAESERIQLIDFTDEHLLFVKIKAGESAASPNRHQLISYNIASSSEKNLHSTNYFNDVMSAKGLVYFSPAEYQANGVIGFYQVQPDGNAKKQIYGEEVWNLFRVSYNIIAASVGQKWYEYDISTGQFNKQAGAPAVLKSRVYVDAPKNSHSAWVDERDGKGVLLLRSEGEQNEDKVLYSQAGLKNPIQWLDDDHIVYRISTNSETADYVISVSGGQPKKIVNVTNIAGIDRWYYY